MITSVKFRTKGLPGQFPPGSFSRDSIRDIVKNPFHIGLIARYPRPPLDMEDDPEHPLQVKPPKRVGSKRRPIELIPGQHEPLYSVQLWQQNQWLRANKAPVAMSKRKSSSTYPLTGVAKCWICWQWNQQEVNLRGSKGGNATPYYRCGTLHDRAKGKKRDVIEKVAGPLSATGLVASEQEDFDGWVSKHHSLRQDRLWPQVLDLLDGFALPDNWQNQILAYYLSDDGLTEFEWQGRNLRNRQKRLQTLYIEGYLDKAEFITQSQEIARQLQILQPEAQLECQKLQPLLANFSAIWQRLNIPELRTLLQICFAGLYFDGHGQLRMVQTHSPFNELFNLDTVNTHSK